MPGPNNLHLIIEHFPENYMLTKCVGARI